MTEQQIKLESGMSAKVAANAKGTTERHNAAAPAEHGKPSWLAIAIIGAIVLVGIGAIATFAGSDEAPAIVQPPSATLPTPEAPKPMPTNNDVRSNNNTTTHGQGSPVINGDGNRVNINIDNSQRTIHHHHTTAAEPKVEPVVRTVLVRTTELRTDDVSSDCNTHMAEHHRRVASWYDDLAAGR